MVIHSKQFNVSQVCFRLSVYLKYLQHFLCILQQLLSGYKLQRKLNTSYCTRFASIDNRVPSSLNFYHTITEGKKLYLWEVFILQSGEWRCHQLEVNWNVSTSLLDSANYPVPSFTTEPKETDPVSRLGQKVSLSLSLSMYLGGAFYALVFLWLVLSCR